MQTYKITSKCDGLELDVLEVDPITPPKGIVQMAHGMAEHKERYLEFMNFLARHGYIAIIHDHRGHGKSIRSKEDRGYFYEEKAEYIVEDLHDITLSLKARYPKLPVYLFGHSMGSLVVRKYIKKYDKDIDKLIVCGSPSKNPLAPFAISLVNFVEKFKGDHHRSAFINNLAFNGYDKKFDENNPNCWLSENKDNVLEYNENENDGFIFTCNGFKNLFTLMKDVYDEKGWAKNHLDLPILFIAGANDPVIISKEDWRQAQVFLNQIGYKNIKGKLYANMRHEILNEIRKEDVMNDILHFLEN